MQVSPLLALAGLLVIQLCAAQNPIQDYVLKNAAEDRIAHDKRIQERLEDRQQHDARVLAHIAHDTAARGGSLVGDAELQANLHSRINSDAQVQHLLSDRISHDQRLVSGIQQKSAFAVQPQHTHVVVPQPQPYYHGAVVQPQPHYHSTVVQPVQPHYHPGPVVQPQHQHYSAANAIPIITYENDINPDGSYKYSYSTGNGISVQEEGVLKEYAKSLGPQGQQIVEPSEYVVGTYAYTSPEGIPVSVSYTADETGFHARTAISHTPNEPHHPHPHPQPQPPHHHHHIHPVAPLVPVGGLDINPKLGTPLVSV